ncbi:hypothetical protein JCM17823_18720 [Halorubrum gandharaense]
MVVELLLGPAIGLLLVAVTFVVVRWDADRANVGRPLLWAVIAAVPVGIGSGMYLYAPVPMTGILVTANTGIVLYGFEREVANEGEQDLDPGTLPNEK